MAASPDKKYLYPMLEGPLYDVAGKFYENVTNPDTGNRTDVLRIWKFNVETKQFEVGGWVRAGRGSILLAGLRQRAVVSPARLPSSACIAACRTSQHIRCHSPWRAG
jgi:hypothetical protein